MIRSLSRRSRSAAASRRASGELGEACALVDPALLVEREPRAGPALEALARDAPADELAGERLDCAGADVVFGLGVDSNCHAQAASPSPPSNIDRGQQHPTRQSLLIAFLLARLTPAFPSSRTALTREAHACPCRTGRRRRRSLVGDSRSDGLLGAAEIRTPAFRRSARAQVIVRTLASTSVPGVASGACSPRESTREVDWTWTRLVPIYATLACGRGWQHSPSVALRSFRRTIRGASMCPDSGTAPRGAI